MSTPTLKAEYEALRQQHEFTVMQLTDLKQNYEQIKKLNTTILQNMMKQPCEFWSEIKVILDGKLYDEKIGTLQQEIDGLRGRINQEVERRVEEMMRMVGNGKDKGKDKHDCQNCQECKNLWGKCPNCDRNLEKIKNLEKVIAQKNQKLDRLTLQIQQKKSDIELLQLRKPQPQPQPQLQKQNKALKSTIKQLQNLLQQHEQNAHSLNQQWQNEYHNLQQQYNQALAELQNYQNYYSQQQEQEQEQQREQLEQVKKSNMMKQIQNIVGVLGGRPSGASTGGFKNGNAQKMGKYNVNGSRIVQDSDFANFSIIDGINRPNQFTYY